MIAPHPSWWEREEVKKLGLLDTLEVIRLCSMVEHGREANIPARFERFFKKNNRGRFCPIWSSSVYNPALEALPPHLDTPAFRAAWGDFCEYRRERRSKLTPTGTKRALAKLGREPVEWAIAMLEHSMESGWLKIADRVQAERGRSRPDGISAYERQLRRENEAIQTPRKPPNREEIEAAREKEFQRLEEVRGKEFADARRREFEQYREEKS